MKLSEYSAYLLGRRDYAEAEFRQKCYHKYPDQMIEVENLIQDLLKHGYLDDVRFTQNFIRSECLKKNGPYKIKQKLILKGVAKGLIEESFEKVDQISTFEAPIRQLIEKKGLLLSQRSPQLTALEKRKRITEFLLRKGFCFDQINKAYDG